MKMKRVLQNILLMFIAAVLALAIGEIAIRIIKPVYDYADRCLFFSSPTFKLYSGGSVRYYPNQKIREIAVYNEKIEYDVLYSTNNLGLIDSRNYEYEFIPGKKYYALVGDSFTAGVNGGSPWVPTLRKNKAHAEIYNFGVSGTGFEHFYRLLHDMKEKVNITHIIIVAITDDFSRGFWHPIVMDGNIDFCNQYDGHAICQPIPIASIVPINVPEKEVIQVSIKKFKEIRAKVDESNAAMSIRSKLESFLYDESAIFYYAKVLFDTYNRTYNRSNKSNEIDEYAVVAMRKIRTEFPLAEIHLVHLPQKYEVMTNNYYINIGAQISELGIKYYPALEKCNWTVDMFFSRDAHPNKYGYENITKCVSDYLFN